MAKFIAFLSSQEHSKTNLRNSDIRRLTMTFKMITARQILLRICLVQLKLHGMGGGQTVFDSITPDDLIIAFFPCIYFCEASQNLFRLSNKNYQNLNTLQKIEKILERSGKRAKFFDLFIQFVGVCFKRNLRIVIENPASSLQFLSAFLKSPSIVDKNRSLRGDYYRKPTAYWFFNCEPTHGFSEQRDKEVRNVWDTKGSDTAGIYGKERSLMSTDYARNWICDFILGKNQPMMQQSFDFDF